MFKCGPKRHKAEPDGNSRIQRENDTSVFNIKPVHQYTEDFAHLSRVDDPVLNQTGIRPEVLELSAPGRSNSYERIGGCCRQ